jgi:hypothetical protein
MASSACRGILTGLLVLASSLPVLSPRGKKPTPYPLEKTIERVLSFTECRENPSAAEKTLYADLAEPIVRQAADWQDAEGRIIDPYAGRETPTTTARFVGALAGLILQGRCLDLAENGRRALSVAARDLFLADRRPVSGPEFYTKELMLGYAALKPLSNAALVKQWEQDLGGFDPEKNYTAVLAKRRPEELDNFCTFGLAGEQFKRKYGLADNIPFIENHLPTQLVRFDAFGMYGDPAFPLTYDAVPRMNLSLLLFAGYTGQYRDELEELLRRGALTMLLTLSPAGETPYGGRSNQQNFNEATAAFIFEYEASRHKKAGDLKLAGAFKRAARQAVLSTRRWLDQRPVRFIKNEFPPSTEHGRQKTYGFYSAYSLLIASQLGFASLLADPAIPECLAPAEIGGYAVRLGDSFHKIFATCRGYHLEIDTRADFDYDATGLGRLHKAGVPTETALSTPITATPAFLTSVPAPPRNVALGPGWRMGGQTRWLAGMSKEISEVCFEPLEEGTDRVRFRVIYRGDLGCREVVEDYRLDRDGVFMNCQVHGACESVYIQVPLIITDGRHESQITKGADFFTVEYMGHTYKVRASAPDKVEARFEEFRAPNRNAIYRVGYFKAKGSAMACHFSLE